MSMVSILSKQAGIAATVVKSTNEVKDIDIGETAATSLRIFSAGEDDRGPLRTLSLGTGDFARAASGEPAKQITELAITDEQVKKVLNNERRDEGINEAIGVCLEYEDGFLETFMSYLGELMSLSLSEPEPEHDLLVACVTVACDLLRDFLEIQLGQAYFDRHQDLVSCEVGNSNFQKVAIGYLGDFQDRFKDIPYIGEILDLFKRSMRLPMLRTVSES